MLGALKPSLIHFTPLSGLGLLAEPYPAARCPENLWPGDAMLGKNLVSRKFILAGEEHSVPRPVNWDMAADSPAWQKAFYEFAWLRDIRAFNDTLISASHARDFVRDWIRQEPHWSDLAYATQCERVGNWLLHHDFICLGAKPEFKRRFWRSILKQVQYIDQALEQHEPAYEFAAVRALLYVSFCLPHAQYYYERGMEELHRLLARDLLPDGGHVSRNPERLAEVLHVLIDIAAALQKCRSQQDTRLNAAIRTAGAMMGFMQHGDGGLACFHGGGEGAADHIAALLVKVGLDLPPLQTAPASRYARLSRGKMIVIADIGAPGSEEDHISALALEVSGDGERLLTSCGPSRHSDPVWQKAMRATAAHSTLCVNDRNSWNDQQEPAVNATVNLAETGASLTAAYNGYAANPGLTHQRMLSLNARGMALTGEDVLIAADGFRVHASHHASLRFHLYPGVRAQRLAKGVFQLITGKGRQWIFETEADKGAELEESIYLGQAGEVRRTQQIVLNYALPRLELAIRWTLRAGDEKQL